MSIAEQIRSNAEVHGIAWAAKHAKKKGINISVVLYSLFNKYQEGNTIMAANKVFWWDAPKGYKAVKVNGHDCITDPCSGCAFLKESLCLKNSHVSCFKISRKDKQFVIFIKRENHA